MSEQYHIRVEKEQFVFSAAHFITFNGDICERLHGHNYGVAVEIEGPLDENHYVFDFIAVRDAMTELTLELDHHVLLPTEHPQVRVTAGEKEVEAVFEDRRWVFPRGDCVLLPVANTTAELIAKHLAHRLLEKLAGRGAEKPALLRVQVDENRGQWACYQWRKDEDAT